MRGKWGKKELRKSLFFSAESLVGEATKEMSGSELPHCLFWQKIRGGTKVVH